MDSVVSLQFAGEFKGSGFVVYTSKNAFLVMTCNHVVAGVNRTFRVAFPGQTKANYIAKVVCSSVEADLALLTFPPDENCKGCAALQFADPETTTLNVGKVEMIGYHVTPSGRLLNPGVFEGSISGEPGDLNLNCDYTSDPGTSGGPVLKGDKVVGVNAEHCAGSRCAISVVTVLKTLRQWQFGSDDLGIDEILPKLV